MSRLDKFPRLRSRGFRSTLRALRCPLPNRDEDMLCLRPRRTPPRGAETPLPRRAHPTSRRGCGHRAREHRPPTCHRARAGRRHRPALRFRPRAQKRDRLCIFLHNIKRIKLIVFHNIPMLYSLFVHPLHPLKDKGEHLGRLFGRQFYKFASVHLFSVKTRPEIRGSRARGYLIAVYAFL